MKTVALLSSSIIPIFIMIGLIPYVSNDLTLSALYAALIIAAFFNHYEKRDFVVFSFGFFIMIVMEYIFVATGVETFVRRSLFGIMPLWLPLLWAYGFVAIKRLVPLL